MRFQTTGMLLLGATVIAGTAAAQSAAHRQRCER
jgi:hypothetical protein